MTEVKTIVGYVFLGILVVGLAYLLWYYVFRREGFDEDIKNKENQLDVDPYEKDNSMKLIKKRAEGANHEEGAVRSYKNKKTEEISDDNTQYEDNNVFDDVNSVGDNLYETEAKVFFDTTKDKNDNIFDAEKLMPKEKNDDWFDDLEDNTTKKKCKNLIHIKPILTTTVSGVSKNPSYDLRGNRTAMCPKFRVGPWGESTYEPDFSMKSLDS